VGRAGFRVWAIFSVENFVKFSSVFEVNRNWIISQKISIIKKNSCSKILDKLFYVSAIFCIFSKKNSGTFLIKFDPTVGFN
jgi:hypothetical protein